MLQSLPIIGAVVSIPVAIASGVMAIVKLAQAIFNKIKSGEPLLPPNDDSDPRYSYPNRHPMKDAFDFTLIFINSVINIRTFGICNMIFITYIQMRIARAS